MLYKLLHKFIPVDLADEAARIAMICNVSGILRKKIAADLVYRVISVFLERSIYRCQYCFHFLFMLFGQIELACVVHAQIPPDVPSAGFIIYILPRN